MSNHSRNFMRRRTMNQGRRTEGHPLRQSQEQQEMDSNNAMTTFDSAKFIPRPVTKSKHSVLFDLHGGAYSYFHLLVALEQQFNTADILMVNTLDGSDYCHSSCILGEVLFATPEARDLAISRGIVVAGIRFLAVPVVNEVSYKDLYRFQRPLHQAHLNWPDNISELNTRGTVFVIEDLPLEKTEVLVGKVTASLECSSGKHQLVKKIHPLITIFGKPHIASSFLQSTVYVVVHGHVDSFSVLKQANDEGQGMVYLDAYSCYQGFNFSRFKFNRVFCFNCNKPDCHFTEDCGGSRIVKIIRSHITSQMAQ
ncbi:hypothetical protein BCR42DRAFT_389592 [Absidia repens]|uniref:Uncharacterized protein n=1 Tax=Absidia repens TaxID=90262 RepID=A0A1X2IQ26_9FUNG|nr:hypothetical protein BCR42DRAFT_389592 [Absidia repens]